MTDPSAAWPLGEIRCRSKCFPSLWAEPWPSSGQGLSEYFGSSSLPMKKKFTPITRHKALSGPPCPWPHGYVTWAVLSLSLTPGRLNSLGNWQVTCLLDITRPSSYFVFLNSAHYSEGVRRIDHRSCCKSLWGFYTNIIYYSFLLVSN